MHGSRSFFSIFNGSPAILWAFDRVQQSRDGSASFLQEANFLWITGIEEPGWGVVIADSLFYLVAPVIDDTHRIFEGGLTNEAAIAISGADKVISAAEYRTLLGDLAGRHPTVFTISEDPHAEHYSFALNPAPARLREELGGVFQEVKDCRGILAKLRAIKRSDEIAHVQQAIDITADAFISLKEKLKDGVVRTEYEAEAQLTYDMRRKGGHGHAYDPIIASGANALTLHYAKNNDTFPDNGLVLIDVGARFNGFAADITRTYAVGSPSDRERAVHAAVEAAHYRIIELIKPGVSLKSYQDMSDEIMKDALRGLGLLNKPSDYRKYFPHAVSHGLGLDVHESLGGFDIFMPGMVLTVEPGIYIPEEGIGVRIEDDILVTEDGNENLSGKLPTSL